MKNLKRGILCLFTMLCMLVSLFSVSKVSSAEVLSDGLDLSKFKQVAFKDYCAVENDSLVIKTGYAICIAYSDGKNLYSYSMDKNEKVTFVHAKPSDYLNANNYVESVVAYNDDYDLALTRDYFETKETKGLSVHLLAYKNGTFYYLGTFKTFDEAKKQNPVDFEKEPELPSIEVNTDLAPDNHSANIYVDYSTPDYVKDIMIRDEDDEFIVDDYRVPSKDYKNGSHTFKVEENGTYYVEVYNDICETGTEDCVKKKVVISGIDTKPDKPDKELPALIKTKPDTKSPKVTFSKFPKVVTNGIDTKIIMYSNEPARLSFEGKGSDKYNTKMTCVVSENGTYNYTAEDKEGNITKGTIKIDFFKDASVVTDKNRDTFWTTTTVDTNSSPSDKLPQTGGVDWKVIVFAGLILVGVGAFIFFKARSSKDNK